MRARVFFLGLGAAVLLGGVATLAQTEVAPVPEIRLPPAVDEGPRVSPLPEVAAPTVAEPLATPVPRDHTVAPDAGEATGLFLPLLTPAPLPETVRMGPSLPAPGILRLTGELAQINLNLQLPETGAVPTELQLVQRSSINILPETAGLQVIVNGGDPVTLPLENLGDFGALRLPATGLVPGANTLGLRLHQPHRVFCGPEASFGVWTEFDLGQSGARLEGAELPANAAGFAMAVASQLGSGRPLRIIAEEDADPVLLRQLAAALGRATRGTGRIEISSFYAMGPRPAAAIALIASDRNRITYRHGARGGLVLQIEHRTGELPDLATALRGFALPGGAEEVPALHPDQPQTLAALGYDDIIGNTRYFRRDVVFALPGDWLLLANQKARLVLNYGFANDLPAGSILLIKVNDQTVHLLPLDRNGGQMQPAHTISFGARLLHSGVNQLSFEMMVPGDPPDAACAPRSTDMLVVSAESLLEVPGSPSMQLAGLTAPLAGLVAEGITLPVGIPASDRLDQLAVRLVAGLKPPETADPRVSLILTDLEHLPLVSLDRQRLPLPVVQRTLWPRPVAATAGSEPAAEPAYRLSDGVAANGTPDSEPGLLDRIYQGVPDILGPGGWFARQRDRLEASAFIGSGETLASWLDERQGDALLLRPEIAEPDRLLLILGPGAEAHAVSQGLNTLRETRLGEGEAALLQRDGSWQLWTPVQLPVLREEVRPSNLLPVLGNYASWSPLVFALGLVGAALISTLPALIVVVHYRRRRLR